MILDRWQRLLLSAMFLVATTSLPLSAQQCGVERWSIKTGTDAGATAVNQVTSSPTTINTLTALTAPQPIPPTTRVPPTETTLWTLNATLLEFKLESDSDYHLVLSDGNGNTMIGEIPSPSCVGATSPFASSIAQARSKFDATYTPGSSFQQVNVPVQITGVGMFDFLHGQTGVAPNGIELHPVLAISFGSGNASGFSISASPASVSLAPGGNATVSIMVTPSGGFSGSVSLSDSGAPAGVTATFNPASVTAPGTSSLALSVAPATSPGTYSLTVSGTGAGSTSAANIILNLGQAGGNTIARSTPSRDDDDGIIRIIPSKQAMLEARQHGGQPICNPRQTDIFLGNGWRDQANQQRKTALRTVRGSLRLSILCPVAGKAKNLATYDQPGQFSGVVNDLVIQTQLDAMLRSRRLAPPQPESIYVIFLAPEIKSAVGGRQAGLRYLAYTNHFHSDWGEVRYLVVPFDSDLEQQKQTVAQGILNLLINPSGASW